MAVRDVNIDLLRKHVYIPVKELSGVSKIDADGGDANWGLGEILGSSASTRGAGGALTNLILMPNLNSLRVTAFKIDTAGGDVDHQIMVPFDMDPGFAFKVRIIYTSDLGSSGATKTYDWKVLYNDPGDAIMVDPATALDTVVAAHAWGGTAYAVNKTAWGQIAADKWTRAQIEAGRFVNFKFELDAVGAGITLATNPGLLLGVEFSYVPQLTKGSGARADNDAA